MDKFSKININVEFDELVGDFIKDEAGKWWLINIKAFKLITHDRIYPKKLLEYEKGKGSLA
jgi:hypothetical protein